MNKAERELKSVENDNIDLYDGNHIVIGLWVEDKDEVEEKRQLPILLTIDNISVAMNDEVFVELVKAINLASVMYEAKKNAK